MHKIIQLVLWYRRWRRQQSDLVFSLFFVRRWIMHLNIIYFMCVCNATIYHSRKSIFYIPCMYVCKKLDHDRIIIVLLFRRFEYCTYIRWLVVRLDNTLSVLSRLIEIRGGKKKVQAQCYYNIRTSARSTKY